MLPLLLLGSAAAAFFLSGCKSATKPQDKQEPQAKPDASASPHPSPSPEASTPASSSYYAAFGRDLVAADLYQKLMAAKVSEENLDRGCFATVSKFVPRFDRAKDRRIEACEVYDFVNDNYQKYPEIAEALAGKPVPWSLDDRDPATLDDNKLRDRIQAVIAKLESSSGFQMLDKSSEDYRQKLAQALAIFVDFPVDPKVMPPLERWRQASEFLIGLGLGDFQQELVEKGGLGAASLAEDASYGAGVGALQALAERRGGNSARAKVLYAVLAQAGLNPSFAFVADVAESDPSIEETNPIRASLNHGGRRLQFLQVAISKDKKDPATGRPEISLVQGLSAAPDPELKVQEWGLSVFLAADLQAMGDYYLSETKQLDAAILPYKNAASLNPADSSIFNGAGVLLKAMGNPAFAETSFQEAVRFDEINGTAFYNLGKLYQEQGKVKAAVEAYFKVAVFSPPIFAKYMDGIEPVAKEALKANPKDENASAIVSKIHQLRTDPD